MVIKTTKGANDNLRARRCLVCGHNWFTQELAVEARAVTRIEVAVGG
jgi:hypothetical protein